MLRSEATVSIVECTTVQTNSPVDDLKIISFHPTISGLSLQGASLKTAEEARFNLNSLHATTAEMSL